MRKPFLSLALVAGAALLWATPVHAQGANNLVVVATCGTIPTALPTGTGYSMFIDQTGKLCVGASVTLGTGSAIIGKVGIDQTTDVTTNGVEIAPTAGAAAGIANAQSRAAASNSVLKAGAGNLYTLNVSIGATSGWVMLFDATSLPSNGATTSSLKFCQPILSNGTVGGATYSWAPGPPLKFTTGITVGFSSTDCNSLTASATAYFGGEVM